MPGSRLDYEAFTGALAKNGALAYARIEVASISKANRPPTIPDAAFAYFQPGNGTTSGRFVIADPTETGWADKDRYRFIQGAMLTMPYQNDDIRSKGQATFFQDLESQQTFVTMFDPVSKGFYLLDGSKAADALGQLFPTISPDNPKDNIRLHIAEILRILRRATNG